MNDLSIPGRALKDVFNGIFADWAWWFSIRFLRKDIMSQTEHYYSDT